MPATDRASPPETSGLAFIDGLEALVGRYDLVLCDVWGVLHDGLRGFRAAGEALSRFRAAGGRVILVSNAPRPGEAVARQLDGFGIGRAAYDAVLTSGDLTRLLVQGFGDRPLHHIGPARDLGLFAGLPIQPSRLEEADYVVCTGLDDDENETVEDYGPRLAVMKTRDLEMLCANPDLVVERGQRLILCAGALAAAYEEIGGRTITAGKPHPPIYAEALRIGTGLLGQEPDPLRVLALGDAIRTDIVGGHVAGLDTLLVARGIHAAELGVGDGPLDRDRVRHWAARQAARPTMITDELRWRA